MSTTGNSVRIRCKWTDWDGGTPAAVEDAKVNIYALGNLIDTLPMSQVEPGLYETFWTPTQAGTYDIHALATVDAEPEEQHTTLQVRS